jgi:hypothetical protein
METELMIFEWPDISPTELAVSNRNACPNLDGKTKLTYLSFPSPTAIILFDSKSQSRSVILPANTRVSVLRICVSLTVSSKNKLSIEYPKYEQYLKNHRSH